VLFPPPAVLPHSSLSHYLEVGMRAFGAPGSDWFVEKEGLEGMRLAEALAGASAKTSAQAHRRLRGVRTCRRTRVTD